MFEAFADQQAPEVLDETAPQACSDPPDSQKRPSQPLQDTACLQSLAHTDPHPFEEVNTSQSHAINSQWRSNELQEALTSHQAESPGQVPNART
ncbi:TPA: hypothetical protein ACH3X2_013459 [Trebouxia sp. C0005]